LRSHLVLLRYDWKYFIRPMGVTFFSYLYVYPLTFL
jgi:hypothetical protein